MLICACARKHTIYGSVLTIWCMVYGILGIKWILRIDDNKTIAYEFQMSNELKWNVVQ